MLSELTPLEVAPLGAATSNGVEVGGFGASAGEERLDLFGSERVVVQADVVDVSAIDIKNIRQILLRLCLLVLYPPQRRGKEGGGDK
mgnify:CR=1 FL=1